MSPLFSDEIYSFHCHTYLSKNKNTTEIDFLNNRIELYQNIIDKKKKIKDIDLKLKVEHGLKDLESHKDYKQYFEIKYNKEIKSRDTEISLSKRYIEFYLKKIKLVKLLSMDDKKENPHIRIFKNQFSYELFEKLQETVSNELADYSFIYRRMINDEFIYESVGESEFRRFLSVNYEVEIDKMKQLHICSTDKKEQLYTSIKNSIS